MKVLLTDDQFQVGLIQAAVNAIDPQATGPERVQQLVNLVSVVQAEIRRVQERTRA